MSRRLGVALLAVMACGCPGGSPGPAAPASCNPALLSDASTWDPWIDPAVVDPRPSPATPTFHLDLTFHASAGSSDGWMTADSRGTLVSSQGYSFAYEAGPSSGSFTCDGDGSEITGTVRFSGTHDGLNDSWETVRARLVGDRLVGTITFEGHEASFEARR